MSDNEKPVAKTPWLEPRPNYGWRNLDTGNIWFCLDEFSSIFKKAEQALLDGVRIRLLAYKQPSSGRVRIRLNTFGEWPQWQVSDRRHDQDTLSSHFGGDEIDECVKRLCGPNTKMICYVELEVQA